MRKTFLLILLSLALYASDNFPKVHEIFLPGYNYRAVEKIAINKDNTRLLAAYYNYMKIIDVYTRRIINQVDYKGTVDACQFVEGGFVLQTSNNFYYYNSNGTKLLFSLDGLWHNFAKMKVQKNGYEVLLSIGSAIHKINLRDRTDQIIPIKTPFSIVDAFYEDTVKVQDFNTHSSFFISLKTGRTVDIPSKQVPIRTKQDTTLCASSSGERFVVDKNKRLYVYETGQQNAIFTVPTIARIKGCVIYDDTLVVASNDITYYNIKNDRELFEHFSHAPEIMPIIGTCADDTFGISLWVSTIYGWDTRKGALKWYSKGPEFQRSHWDNASYKMELASQNGWALVQPYGQRAFGYELKVDLKNGRYEDFDSKKNPKLPGKTEMCDPGNGDSLRKSYYFTRKGEVKFYALSGGEWLVISDHDGYFNASSLQALSILHRQGRPLSQSYIRTYYRPDIIEAKLASRPIKPLLAKQTHYSLPNQSNLRNVYFDSFYQELQAKNYKRLQAAEKEASPEQLQQIIENIPDDKDGYALFYQQLFRGVTRKKGLERLTFLEDRIKSMKVHTYETAPLLHALCWLEPRKYRKEAPNVQTRVDGLIDQLYGSYKMWPDVRQVVSDSARPKASEKFEDAYWKRLENRHYIYDDKLAYLYQKDPARTEALLIPTLTSLIQDITQHQCLPSSDNRSSIKEQMVCRQYTDQLKSYFNFLTLHDIRMPMDPLKILALKLLSPLLLDDKIHWLLGYKPAIMFYLKYATPWERQGFVGQLRQTLSPEDCNRIGCDTVGTTSISSNQDSH